jgi:hypothetical protein
VQVSEQHAPVSAWVLPPPPPPRAPHSSCCCGSPCCSEDANLGGGCAVICHRGVKVVTLVVAQAYAWRLCHELSTLMVAAAHDRRPAWCGVSAVWTCGSSGAADVKHRYDCRWEYWWPGKQTSCDLGSIWILVAC